MDRKETEIELQKLLSMAWRIYKDYNPTGRWLSMGVAVDSDGWEMHTCDNIWWDNDKKTKIETCYFLKGDKQVNIILDDGAKLPNHAHYLDAGYDLYTPKKAFVPAHSDAVIDTGVHFEIPQGYYGKLESKSGLNVKSGIVCLGGVIDSGYTGSVKVKLYNLSDDDYIFDAGDKVVQIIFQPCLSPELKPVEQFADSERGEDGFGSTGK